MLGMGLLLNSTSVQTPVQLGESLQQSSSAEQLGASGSVPHICDAADATKRRRSAERSMAKDIEGNFASNKNPFRDSP